MSTTVLVIEDDLEINELLGEYLALEDFQYLQATTGQGGIHLANAHHPDAIILDLMLPDIDGFEVARILSAHRATFNIPIIILSCMCQDCDKEKAYSSGALFFMNKPFLPDDLLSTVRQALEWKAGLGERTPAGSILLGTPTKGAESEKSVCSKSMNQMVTDLFARTDLTDPIVQQIREAIETLSTWARQWNTEHAVPSHMNVEYRIQIPARETNGHGPCAPTVEWKLTEDAPGILTDAFFKPTPSDSGSWSSGGGLLGWGATSLMSKPLAPIAPPAQWLQVLAKTGAARFEKDSKSQTVRFSRSATGNSPSAPIAGPVPVVEIDGMRYPTRLRDEALAAKRK